MQKRYCEAFCKWACTQNNYLWRNNKVWRVRNRYLYKKTEGWLSTRGDQKVSESSGKKIHQWSKYFGTLCGCKVDSYLHDIKQKKLGFKTRTYQSLPAYVKDQAARAKTACRKIVDKAASLCGVLTFFRRFRQKIFSFCPGKSISPQKKIKPKTKFFHKHLVWQCIDENGNVSKPFVSKGTMNSKVYKSECLKKRLIPFSQNRDVFF